MKLPEKGLDVKAIDSKGDYYYLFRCACANKNCKEWRDSLTGYHVTLNIISWEYENNRTDKS